MLRLSEEPKQITAFDKGAVGEESLGRQLDRMRHDGILSLHDRRRRRSRGNIDHLVVSRGGVLVIDSKRYRGHIRTELTGPLFSRRERLYVDWRDCTTLAAKVREQMAEVGETLSTAGWNTPIRAVLCFIDSEWGPLARPFTFDRVLVTRPEWLASQLRADGPLSFDAICTISELLAERFPSA